jgi:hypothetical protein
MDKLVINDGSEGDGHREAVCPLCDGTDFGQGPEVVWTATADSSRGLTIRPAICERCGFIAPMLAKSQPAAE